MFYNFRYSSAVFPLVQIRINEFRGTSDPQRQFLPKLTLGQTNKYLTTQMRTMYILVYIYICIYI